MGEYAAKWRADLRKGEGTSNVKFVLTEPQGTLKI